MTKKTTFVRIENEVKEKAKDLSRELSVIQKQDVSMVEVFKRTFNIPNLKEVLHQDAINKRRQR